LPWLFDPGGVIFSTLLQTLLKSLFLCIMVQEIDLEQLDEFARSFWKLVGNAKVFAFHGEMGAGKTTLTAALCRAKGVQNAASSPTFSIINEYVFEENGAEEIIYHIDLYRLNSHEEILQTGVEDCVNSGAICLVEWPDKASWLFDENTVQVTIKAISETRREIKVEIPSAALSK
jgi:tRNA threonylcarbamoyladenosine biosynthesis protein TsaE